MKSEYLRISSRKHRSQYGNLRSFLKSADWRTVVGGIRTTRRGGWFSSVLVKAWNMLCEFFYAVHAAFTPWTVTVTRIGFVPQKTPDSQKHKVLVQHFSSVTVTECTNIKMRQQALGISGSDADMSDWQERWFYCMILNTTNPSILCWASTDQ